LGTGQLQVHGRWLLCWEPRWVGYGLQPCDS
jgi:hypothetical protein